MLPGSSSSPSFPLPQGVVGVLHRQRIPLGFGPRQRAAYASSMSRTSGTIDAPSPAMWCSTSTSTSSTDSTLSRVARTGMSVDRSKGRRASARTAAGSSSERTAFTDSDSGVRSTGRMRWKATPSDSSKTVRRASWRATTSTNAVLIAPMSKRPVSLATMGML